MKLLESDFKRWMSLPLVLIAMQLAELCLIRLFLMITRYEPVLKFILGVDGFAEYQAYGLYESTTLAVYMIWLIYFLFISVPVCCFVSGVLFYKIAPRYKTVMALLGAVGFFAVWFAFFVLT